MQIDVFHDTVCPWCRIGKAHLKTALSRWDGEPVTVQYHTFFLNPNIPPQGYNFREYMHAKGGGQVPLEQWFFAPREMGAKAGLSFNFEAITHAPNSTLSHQLIALAPDEHREEVIDALYTAYFEEGRNIGDLAVLVDIAVAHGFDAATIQQHLQTGLKQADVLADARYGAQIGVTGVPFFVVDRRLAFSGAQPPEVILDVMKQAISMKELDE